MQFHQKLSLWTWLLLFALLASGRAKAQEIPMAEPTKEHAWLQKFEGKWETQMTSRGGETIMTGTIESKMLGKLWVVNSMVAHAGDTRIEGRQTIGFDSKKGKYIGTWIDSTSEYTWQYEGVVDKDGRRLALDAEGPDMLDPSKLAKYRDSYEFTSEDEMKVTSSVQDANGNWIDFMQGTGKRVK